MLTSALAAYQKHNMYGGAKLGFKDPNNIPDDNFLEEATKQVFREHKRKASQFDALKLVLGEQVEEEFAISLAKDVVAERHDEEQEKEKEENGNYSSSKSNLAPKFEIGQTRFDDNDYMIISNKENNKPLLVVNKSTIINNNPDHNTNTISSSSSSSSKESQAPEQRVQEAITRAFSEHSRKVSQFRSLEASFAEMFGEEVGSQAAQHMMKGVNPIATNSQTFQSDTGRRDSVQLETEEAKNEEIEEENGHEHSNNDNNNINNNHMDGDVNNKKGKKDQHINIRMTLLEKQLAFKTEMIGRMQLEIEDLRNQKLELLVSANDAINQLRTALLSCHRKGD